MRKLMWFSIGFCLSCITGVYLLSGQGFYWIAAGCIAAALALIFLKPKLCKILATLLIGFSFGVGWMWGYNSLYLDAARQYDGKEISTSMTAADYSYETKYGSAADCNIYLEGKSYRVRVYFSEIPALKPGDTLSGSFTLGLTVPDGSEASDYYQGKGIFLVAEAAEEIQVTACRDIPAKFFAVELRHKITDLMDRIFPEDVRGFVRALLLGDSSLLTYEEDTAFKVSGIRHVIAVSGLHVSILFALVYTAVGKHRVWTAVAGIPVLLLFAAVAGFTPSIVRACVMQSLMMLALLLKKEYDPPTALAFAVLVILLINPMTITSVSFQLSVGCMIGIFLFSSRVSHYILRKLGSPTGKSIKARLSRWFAGGVGVTLSAMTVTMPLVCWYFGMVSLVGVLTNLLTLWVISFIFYGIMLACICGAIWLPMGTAVASFVALPVRFVLWIAKGCAALPLSAVYTCSSYIVIWIAVSYLLFGVFLLSKKRSPVLLCSCILLCLAAALAASYIEPRLDDFRMTVIDVGEGQTILLQNAGEYYLVDCGGDSGEEAADLAAETLLSQGVRKLDGVILTHYDTDHAGGLLALLTRIEAKRLYLPDIADDKNTKQTLAELYTDRITWVRENTALGDITLIPAPCEQKDENENGLCILFQPENYDILITGDRGEAGEQALLESISLPKLELLVAGHHGAAGATGLRLLSATKPDMVVISTGNRYGHPAKHTMYRLSLFHSRIWRTDLSGTLIFRG